jgi:hypothetical protein
VTAKGTSLLVLTAILSAGAGDREHVLPLALPGTDEGTVNAIATGVFK